jgi:arylsulfatase A-like enzyme/acetyl esterase/lipase
MRLPQRADTGGLLEFYPIAFKAMKSPLLLRILWVCAVWVLSVHLGWGAEVGTVRPPNIVLILADDLGYGDVGCFGGTRARTPNLDRMAAEGVCLTNFYVAQAVCTASRAAFLSGCYPNRIGMSGALNHTSLSGISPGEVLLSELLNGRGYATGAFGKWHLGQQLTFWPVYRGFNQFEGLPYSNDNGPAHPTIRGMPPLPWYAGDRVAELNPDQSRFTRRITERAVRFIEEHRAEPFFLYVPHVMPHVPIAASGPWEGRSGRGLYADVVEELDASVGAVLEALRKQGIEEQTLVIFTSDNGPFLSYGEHAGSSGPFREGKLTAFEGGVRMPCVVRWPRTIAGGRREEALFTAMDWYPTLAGLAGCALPAVKLDGVDLSAVLLGTENGARREAFWFYSGEELHAVRVGRWKLHVPHDYLTVAGEPGVGGKPSNFGRMRPEAIEESGVRGIASRHGYRVERIGLSLFDLEVDPGERVNVAEREPAVVERLLGEVGRARAELGDRLVGVCGTGVRGGWNVLPKLGEGVRRVADLEYARRDTGALRLDLYLPKEDRGVPEAGWPVVLWIHGGGWVSGSKEEHCVLAWLAEEGVAVASLNYRLVHEARWPAQIEDCREALRWLRSNASRFGLDPAHLAAAGASAGGHLAALLGTPLPDRPAEVCAVVDFFGPTDFLRMPGNQTGPGAVLTHGERLLGGRYGEREGLAREASPLYRVSERSAAFLMLHGARDRLVPLEQSARMQEALQRVGVLAQLVVLPEGRHGGNEFDAWEYRERIRVFLRQAFGRP